MKQEQDLALESLLEVNFKSCDISMQLQTTTRQAYALDTHVHMSMHKHFQGFTLASLGGNFHTC